MQITLEIKETVFDKFIWMLGHFNDEVQIINNDESIDIESCLKTKEKVQRGKLDDFEAIEDIDAHIKELVDATR